MDILIKALQLILSLSILVFVHELGHFFFARLFKIRVDKFYMFFNPYFSIVRFKSINGKWHIKWISKNEKTPTRDKLDENGYPVLDKKGRPEKEPLPTEQLPDSNWNKYGEKTEWGIGWLPLGGYCKISGMIDESMDKEQMKQEPKPWEFRSKPAWQRFFVMLGGVLFNVALAMIIYWGMLFTWGEQYLANKDAVNGVVCSALAKEIGFENGDKVLSLDGKKIEKFDEIQIDIIRNKVKKVEIERNGQSKFIEIPDTCIGKILKTRGFLLPRAEFIIGDLEKNSTAERSGFEKKDRIISINNNSVKYLDQASDILSKNKSKEISIDVLRNNDTVKLQAMLSEQGTLGVRIENNLKFTQINYGFFEAFPAGISKGISGIKNYVKDLGLIFSPKTKAYESVGSFIAIGNIFPNKWIWEVFWSFTALLSIMLAIINILPIPALDGGHAIFVLYEMIFRRKPSDKFLESAQLVGLVILMSLMLLAVGNDVFNFIIK